MFFSSPSADLNFIVVMLVIAFVISAVVYFKTKKILASVFLMSLFSNFVLYGNIDFNFAKRFDLLWSFGFIRHVWPYINLFFLIILVLNYFKNKYVEKNKK